MRSGYIGECNTDLPRYPRYHAAWENLIYFFLSARPLLCKTTKRGPASTREPADGGRREVMMISVIVIVETKWLPLRVLILKDGGNRRAIYGHGGLCYSFRIFSFLIQTFLSGKISSFYCFSIHSFSFFIFLALLSVSRVLCIALSFYSFVPLQNHSQCISLPKPSSPSSLSSSNKPPPRLLVQVKLLVIGIVVNPPAAGRRRSP